MSNKTVASISICGELTLNLHSLNNEGGEGNQIITRQVTIVDEKGEEHTVNAISGDMFKHIHAANLANLAIEKMTPQTKDSKADSNEELTNNGFTVCKGCAILSPNRINDDDEFNSYLKSVDTDKFNKADKEKYQQNNSRLEAINKLSKEEKGKKEIKDEQKELKAEVLTLKKAYKVKEVDVIDYMIKKCIVDDVHGNLVTANNNSLDKKSVIEFGWTVGIPNAVSTETHFHIRKPNNGDPVPFNRPTNSGKYAIIMNFEVFKLSLNDRTRSYPFVENEERKNRYDLVMKAILSTFLNPQGSMTSQQKPHITDFSGVISVSSKLLPAPTVSALNSDYKSQIEVIKSSLNAIEGEGTVETLDFKNLGEFTQKIKELISYEPYKI